jgi:phosphohistidine phosphatase SixA
MRSGAFLRPGVATAVAVVALAASAAACSGDQPETPAAAATTGPAPGPTTGSVPGSVSGSAPGSTTVRPSVPPRRPDNRDLAARLRDGGYVIYFRHPVATSGTDQPAPDLADRRTQRNLSPAGRVQARELGQTFARLRIPLGDVLASPYARTREAAELAFGPGRVRTTRDLISEGYPGVNEQNLARALRRLLTTRPLAGRNTVLVSHGFNIQTVMGFQLAEAEAAIFAPNGGSAPRLVTRLRIEQWRTFAAPR